MKIGYFDCIGGASGDMILGSLIDVGLPIAVLKRELEKLPIQGWTLNARKIVKKDISATSIEVHVKKQTKLRNLQIIESLIKKSSLPKMDIDCSIEIFRRLAKAEAHVHGTTVDNVHFHEIGAIDTIIDVVGTVYGLRLLNIERVIVSPFPIGKVGPAAIELLKDLPIFSIEEQRETVTPTGAVILSTVAKEFGALPPCTIKKIGYGAGKLDFQTRPNVLRFMIGESNGETNNELLVLLETNIDDMNPQIYDYVSDRLFEQDALDVWLIPIQMKKNRPAITLSILCRLAHEKKLAGILFEEGLTLGIRRQLVDRLSLLREIRIVKTKFGPIRVKVACYNGKVVRAVPEYDDCKKTAAEKKVSIQTVIDSVRDTALSTSRHN